MSNSWPRTASGVVLPPERSRVTVQEVIGGPWRHLLPRLLPIRLALPAVMKISAKTEYACIAMLELAANYGSGEPVPIRAIAERHEVPPRFMVQILLQLKAAGLVASTRGAAGGYHLIRPPEDVSLGRVMDVIEGSTSTTKSPSASPDSPTVKLLMRVWQDVAAKMGEMLGRITFAELVDRAKEEDALAYDAGNIKVQETTSRFISCVPKNGPDKTRRIARGRRRVTSRPCWPHRGPTCRPSCPIPRRSSLGVGASWGCPSPCDTWSRCVGRP